MNPSHHRLRSLVVLATVVGAVLWGLGAPGSAQSGSTPGVTAKTVKIGFIFSKTGVASSVFATSGDAFQARIDRQNAQGGVNGRKIETEIIDDASSAANLSAAQDLVQNRNVFAVVNNSSFAFLSYRYLKDAGVPMIGGGFDGQYYGQPGNEDIISAGGNIFPKTGLAYDDTAKVMKKLGATKVAALAYGSSASSAASAVTLQKYAVPAQGMEPVYTNTTVDFGTSDVGPLVLGIKNAGADAVYLPMVASTNLAVVQGLTQNGVTQKANVLATGYGQDLLDQPVASTLDQHTVFWTQNYEPVELKTPATKKFQADLKKYAKFTGVPNYGQYLGYITAELAILGLEHGGKNPTRQSFLDGLHTMGTYDQAGLSCRPIDISLENIGKSPATSCSYYVYEKDGKFVVTNNGKPIIGKIVGTPEDVAAATSASSAASATTTTTGG
jgi:ABC-type branched-subunit amino acid transport system substrate-binding protein